MCVGSSSDASTAAFGIAGEERVHQHARVAVGQLEAGMAQEADVHVSVSSFVVGLCGSRRRCSPAHGRAPSPPPPRSACPSGSPRRGACARGSACSPGSGSASAWRSCDSCASPNQPPSLSACARMRCSCGAIADTRRSAPAKRSGSESARTAASTCSSVNTAGILERALAREERQRQSEHRAGQRRRPARPPRSPRSPRTTAARARPPPRRPRSGRCRARRRGAPRADRPRARRTAAPAPRRSRPAPGRRSGRRAAAARRASRRAPRRRLPPARR